MYLVKLSQDKCSSAKVNQAFYGINWLYTLSGREPIPCENSWLKLCLDSCQRQSSRPTQRKEPITSVMIQAIVKHYANASVTFADLRIAVLCLLSFSGFLHFSQVISIRLSDISIDDTY